MNKEAFARGWTRASIAAGVDPVALAKYAEATPVTDTLLSLPGNALLGAIPGGGVLPYAAYYAGLASDVESDDSKRDTMKALIPGVGAYRMGNRIRGQVRKELDDIKKDKKFEGAKPVRHAVAEHLGGGTSALLSALAGAGVGALGAKDKAFGAGVGAAGGLGVSLAAELVASIMAAAKRRRTKEEQIESDKSSVLAKYLLPGVATYDRFKRIGRSQGDREESDSKKKKD